METETVRPCNQKYRSSNCIYRGNYISLLITHRANYSIKTDKLNIIIFTSNNVFHNLVIF